MVFRWNVRVWFIHPSLLLVQISLCSGRADYKSEAGKPANNYWECSVLKSQNCFGGFLMILLLVFWTCCALSKSLSLFSLK